MLCRAKVNLTLHVGATIPTGQWQGYHPVESLVVFADFGDRLSFETAKDAHGLSITGPFGQSLSVESDNLILKALHACDAPATQVFLHKQVPVSAGLGGGSTNAAAILRAFDPKGRVDASSLGADVPVSRLSQTAIMEGIGERLTPLPGLGRIPALLVNPRVPVSTAAIFKAFDAEGPSVRPDRTRRTGTLLQRAQSGRNDLQSAAERLEPAISHIISAIADEPGCALARMSGSGATCFGLFETIDAAAASAKRLEQKGWWVMPCWLGDDEPLSLKV
jgi:4-diphosphocytidyl-2-C-methyl-D-erythritol kinase